jgi:hypothetical protein
LWPFLTNIKGVLESMTLSCVTVDTLAMVYNVKHERCFIAEDIYFVRAKFQGWHCVDYRSVQEITARTCRL